MRASQTRFEMIAAANPKNREITPVQNRDRLMDRMNTLGTVTRQQKAKVKRDFIELISPLFSLPIREIDIRPCQPHFGK
jgi:hypothetical protein